MFPASSGTVDSLNTLEELRESDESDCVSSSASLSSSPRPSKLRSSSRLPLAHLPSFRGTDISDARCALATILTSSISKGILVKRLRNSATFPKLHESSSFECVTQHCPDNGVCAQHESILNSKLPTEPEWEDPVEKKGMITFKVVPSKKPQSQDPEVSPDTSDECQTTVAENESEATNNPTSTEEDSCAPPRPESEGGYHEVQTPDSPDSASPLLISACQQCPALPPPEVADTDKRQETKEEDQGKVITETAPAAPGDPPSGVQIGSDQSEVPSSPSKDLDHSGSDDKEVYKEAVQAAEEEEKEKEEEEDNRFPPPPPPVFFMEEQEEDNVAAATSTGLSPQPTSPACSRRTGAFSGDHPVQSSVAMSAAAPEQHKASATPSRFAQAVALAVQRSRLQSQGKALDQQAPSDPHETRPSTHRSTYQHGES